MTVIAPDVTALQVAEDVRRTGGSTRSVVPGIPVPTTGYMVSLRGSQQTIPDGHWSDESIADYIDAHRNELSHPGRYVGAWESDGLLYLDISVKVAELRSAVELGQANDQLAIWDVAAEREIRLDHVEPFPMAA